MRDRPLLFQELDPIVSDRNYQAIGRAISHGYLLIGIFPNTISKVFMAALLAAKDVLSADDYICGLLGHVSEYDSLQLKSVLETSRLLVFFQRRRPRSSWISYRNMEWFKSLPPPHYEVFWPVSLKWN